MNQYTVTAKLWITLDTQSPEEAETAAKNTIDEALYHYVKTVIPDTTLRISKAKVTWVKETQPHETQKKH